MSGVNKVFNAMVEFINKNPSMGKKLDIAQLGALLKKVTTQYLTLLTRAAAEAYTNTDDTLMEDSTYDILEEALNHPESLSETESNTLKVNLYLLGDRDDIMVPKVYHDLMSHYEAKKPKMVKMDELEPDIFDMATLEAFMRSKSKRTKIKPKIKDKAPPGKLVPTKIKPKFKPKVKVRGRPGKVTTAVPAPPAPKAADETKTSVGALPRGPRVELPYYLGSMDKKNVDKWLVKYPDTKIVTAKMDGISALYTGDQLFTRGDGKVGQDISRMMSYLGLPDTSYAVRGEIIMKTSLFESKHSSTYKNPRNTAGGVVNAFGAGKPTAKHIEMASQLDFIAYEIVSEGGVMTTRAQLAQLEADGFNVVKYEIVDGLTMDQLATLHTEFREALDYLMDGLVIYTADQLFPRNTSKNPKYAIAYKGALINAETTVIDVEWNVSKHGRLIPVVIVEPVELYGTTNERASGKNAGFIRSNGIGPGARILVTKGGEIIPDIVGVIEPTDAAVPDLPYKWENERHVNYILDQDGEEQVDEYIQKKNSKKLLDFFRVLEVKGVGPSKAEAIVANGFNVKNIFEVKASDISELGPKSSAQIVTNLHNALDDVDIAKFMSASQIFGTGIGETRLNLILDEHPNMFVGTKTVKTYCEEIIRVAGFAKITANLAAEGLVEFLDYVEEIDTSSTPESFVNLVQQLIDRTYVHDEQEQQEQDMEDFPEFEGRGVAITGGHKGTEDIEKFVKKQGGSIQKAVNGKTLIVIRKDADYENKKTEAARSRGLDLLTFDEFRVKYGL